MTSLIGFLMVSDVEFCQAIFLKMQGIAGSEYDNP